MRFVLFDGPGSRVLEGDFRTVLIESERGTVLAVVTEYQPGLYHAAHFKDPGFTDTLRGLGIDRTTVVEEVRGPKLASMGL